MDTILITLIISVCIAVFTYLNYKKLSFRKHKLEHGKQEISEEDLRSTGKLDPISSLKTEFTAKKNESRNKYVEPDQLKEDLLHQKAISIQKSDLLHILLESSTHGILAIDTDWRVVVCNTLFCEMWGLPKDIVYVGANGRDIFKRCIKKTTDPERFILQLRKLSNAPNMSWNGHLYLSDGKILNCFATPIIGLNGTYQGKNWEISDITDDFLKQQEREQSYKALVQKGFQLAVALENSGDGLWTWDTGTDLFSLNPEFASRYQTLHEVQPINHFFRLAPSGEQSRCLNIFREIAKKSSGGHIEFEFRMQSRKNIWHWFILRGVVSDVDDDGLPLLVTGTLVDITKRKQYEKHLRELNQKMMVLSQITRHDIANQVSKLFLLSDAISDTLSDAISDESEALIINNMLEQMNQGLVTVKHQVEFAKAYQEIGLHGAKWQSVNACIEGIIPLLIRPSVTLSVDNIPMIYADPLLEKALYNLVENSLRHGERVTQIKLTFSVVRGNNGILVFEDNGVGIPDAQKNKIFDKDFGKNTGLGLFLIREIFSLTGMAIQECGKEGKGVRFEIMVPSGCWKWEKNGDQ